jgi:hypothetical protein
LLFSNKLQKLATKIRVSKDAHNNCCAQLSKAAFMQEGKANKLNICDECGSEYYRDTSKMTSLCTECAHILYGYEKCKHAFKDGRCINCYWDGSTSHFLNSIREKPKQN